MARASITGQPAHLQSLLVPGDPAAGLEGESVNLGDHHKKVLRRACVVAAIAMLASRRSWWARSRSGPERPSAPERVRPGDGPRPS